MMRKLGKLSSAVVLALLCLALFSTGVFAQSASRDTANNAAQRSMTHVTQTVKVAVGHQQGVWRGRLGRFGHVGSGIRVTRSARVTNIMRITKVKITRVTKTLRVTRWLHQSHARRFSCGWGC